MRFFPSILVFVVAFIWAAAFIYLSLDINEILEGFALLVLGTISSFVLAYWAHLLRRNQRLFDRFHFLQQGIASLAPTIESVIFDDKGKMLLGGFRYVRRGLLELLRGFGSLKVSVETRPFSTFRPFVDPKTPRKGRMRGRNESVAVSTRQGSE